MKVLKISAAIFIWCLLNAFSGSAQILSPVKWTWQVEYGKAGEATIIYTATIDAGWHLYSQDLPDGGPIKTSFSMTANEMYTPVGPVEEEKPVEYYDKNFEMQLKYFSGTTHFRQKIKFSSGTKFTIPASVEYMVCDDHQCLPPTVAELNIDIAAP